MDVDLSVFTLFIFCILFALAISFWLRIIAYFIF